MPVGTISQELHHRDLKTLPEAWVKLRQLPYYQMLVRRDKGSVASMEQQIGGKRKKDAQTAKMYIESLQTWEMEYMFRECIAEHNITDDNDQLLNFSNPLAIRSLRPDVGAEIEKYINELNGGDEVDEDFPYAATNSSSPPTLEQKIPEIGSTTT